MRITVFASLLLGLAAACVSGESIAGKQDDQSLLNCVLEDNSIGCLRTRLARNMDEMEMKVTGKKSEIPMSTVMEQAGNFVAEVVDDIQNPGRAEELEEPANAGDEEEGRGRKNRKKKKKHLQKLLGLAMLFKAKLSLLLQLISTHFQLKFFVIAILTLIINAVKFWMDLKAHPSKVIYYEHAQHQHHYDHDDHEHGYWGRSSNDSPQDLAYSSYAPKKA